MLEGTLLHVAAHNRFGRAMQNVSSGICGQRKPRSRYASAQSDHCLLTESLNTTDCMTESNGLDDTVPASILYKSISDRYRPVSYPDGPITARYRLCRMFTELRMFLEVKWTCLSNRTSMLRFTSILLEDLSACAQRRETSLCIRAVWPKSSLSV